jgi:hypothetical protein
LREEGTIMLGEMIGETHTKRIVRRVISAEGAVPVKIEVSFEDSGNLLGIDTTGFGSYCVTPRPDGMFYLEGQGVGRTGDGEMVAWKGSALGRLTGGGAISQRGTLYFQTPSQRLARLNSVPVVFEHEVDPNGEGHGRFWEWK